MRFLVLAVLMAAASPARAADDVDYLFRLGMMEGHLIIAGELLDAGQVPMALPHFGHPVQELYEDIAEAVLAKHLRPFDSDLIALEAAVAGAPNDPATKRKFAEVIGLIHRARAAAPPALRDSVPEMIRICADTVDAAAGEYGEALDRGQIDSIVEYHDSRGYLAYVAQELDRLGSEASAPEQGMIARFRAVLARAQWIVAPLLPGVTPRATLAQYRDIAAEAAQLAGT